MAKKKKNNNLVFYLFLIILLLSGYLFFAFNANLANLTPIYQLKNSQIEAQISNLTVPKNEEAAIGVQGQGVIQTFGSKTMLPMASTSKLVTALMILKKYPLSLGQSGPIINLTANDQNIYNSYLSEQGSVVKVVAGENLSEYQMLEAMLLPSADNIADSLAIWAYGSLSNYSTQANQFLEQNNIIGVHIGSDASGYDPSSVANSSGLILLGEKAYQNPIIAQIVGLKEVANFPVVGIIKNINYLLGQDGINGIKTGNNNQDGGIFISESNQEINGQEKQFYTAILGAPSLWYVLNDSLNLVKSLQSNFTNVNQVANLVNNSIVGYYNVPWSKSKDYIYINKISPFYTWNGSTSSLKIHLSSLNINSLNNQSIGSIQINNSLLDQTENINLFLKSKLQKPSIWWLLYHPKLVLGFI